MMIGMTHGDLGNDYVVFDLSGGFSMGVSEVIHPIDGFHWDSLGSSANDGIWIVWIIGMLNGDRGEHHPQ